MGTTIEDQRLDALFTALSDRTRRDIVARLSAGEATVKELAEPYAMSMQAVSQHIRVLERSGLISQGRHRQTRPCRLEPAALEAALSWIEESRRTWSDRMDRLETHLARLQERESRERRRARLPAGLPRAARAGVAVPRPSPPSSRSSGARAAWPPRSTASSSSSTPVAGSRPLMIGEHGSHRMVATFTEVVPPERLAWVESATGMHTTSTLHDLGDGSTAVVIHQRNVPETMRLPEARAGFLTSLDKLEEHLAHLMPGRPIMTDPQSWVAPTYTGLADLLAAAAVDAWDAPSLCEKWLVRHVVAHVTMPARLTPEQFGAEMAAAGGDFTVLSDTVATRDAALPVADLLDQLRSPGLHAWQPPGGGAAGALNHAVIHSLDVTIALDRPAGRTGRGCDRRPRPAHRRRAAPGSGST